MPDESDDGDVALSAAGGHAMASGGPHRPSLPENFQISGVSFDQIRSDGAHVLVTCGQTARAEQCGFEYIVNMTYTNQFVVFHVMRETNFEVIKQQ